LASIVIFIDWGKQGVTPSLPPLLSHLNVLHSTSLTPFLPPYSSNTSTSSSSIHPFDPPSTPSALVLEESSSSSDTSSGHYFLISMNKDHSIGLALDLVTIEKSERGRKSLISKAQKKAKIDLQAGKQVYIERVLRERRTLGKGP
jgi:hypothetical protein